jgi:hypothetical protein
VQVNRVAVIVPGMMGSVLERTEFRHGTQTIWGEDLTENYRTLIGNPGILRWADNPAKARLMRFVRLDAEVPLLHWNVPFKKIDLWGRTIDLLKSRSDFARIVEFGYDWRAPLSDSASMLVSDVHADAGISLSDPAAAADTAVTFITHSMGGLVVRFAIAAGIIHPSRIDRIIHIGAPLKGSPAAFRTAYDRLDLPLFSEIFGLLRRKNRASFEHHLLECIRTFPSLYHLLPPKEIPYLYYSPSSRSNPLREKAMREDERIIATKCHQMLERAHVIISEQKIRVRTIYTEVHSGRDTELEYRVVPLANGLGYTIEAAHAHTLYGDGTVPCDSARGDPPVQGISVINVDHMYLCNDERVVKCLSVLL